MSAAYLNASQRIDPKTAATLKARAALVGVVLNIIESDRGTPLLIASKWAMTRQMESAEECDAFLRRIGGPGA